MAELIFRCQKEVQSDSKTSEISQEECLNLTSTETLSPETHEKAPGAYPGVYNTVIPLDNFYMELSGNKLKAKDIIGVWRYMYNLTVMLMRDGNLLDKFGRMKRPPTEFLAGLYILYWRGDCEGIIQSMENMTHHEALEILANDILKHILENMSEESEEWAKIYPTSILIVPIVQIIQQIIHCPSTMRFLRINRNVPFAFDFRLAFAKDYDMHIDFDVKNSRNVISIRMANQYGNDVYLNIRSNTWNFDDFIDDIDKQIIAYSTTDLSDLEAYLKGIVFNISQLWTTSRKRKLLLSVIAPPVKPLHELDSDEEMFKF